jgi:hypothetical protein
MKAGNQGVSSRNVVRPGYRNGAPNRAASVKATSQIGTSVGTHITGRRQSLDHSNVAKPLYRGAPALPSDLGNMRASSCPTGPGGGRTVARTGSQGKH